MPAFRLSTRSVMGMRTVLVQAAMVSSVRPWPSLPMTTHTPPGQPDCAALSGWDWYSAAARQVMPFARSCATACGMAPASMTGMRTAAPMEARRVLGAHTLAQPSLSSTPSKPKAAALRSSVPTLPGSCTRSSAR